MLLQWLIWVCVQSLHCYIPKKVVISNEDENVWSYIKPLWLAAHTCCLSHSWDGVITHCFCSVIPFHHRYRQCAVRCCSMMRPSLSSPSQWVSLFCFSISIFFCSSHSVEEKKLTFSSSIRHLQFHTHVHLHPFAHRHTHTLWCVKKQRTHPWFQTYFLKNKTGTVKLLSLNLNLPNYE